MRKRLLFDDSSKEESLLDLTPLIDVVFVVLIMFIIMAPLVEMEKVELAHSSTQTKTTSTSVENTTVHVQKDGTILLNKTKVDPNEFLTKLTVIKKHSPQMIPQVYHDKDATFGTYQMVKSILEKAGFTQMDLIVKEQL